MTFHLLVMLLSLTPAIAIADNLVSLVMTVNPKSGCGSAKLDFLRVQPDGTVGEEVFRIPQRQMLIITDLDWLYATGAPATTKSLTLFIENLADPAKRQPVLRSTVRLNADGAGGASERLTTGIQISSAARVCVEMLNEPTASPRRLHSVLLRGFLAPESN